MSDRLQGKVTRVTGAGRGIGEAIARAFAAEDAFAFVSVTDRDAPTGRAVAAAIGEDQAQFAALDVRDETAWDGVMADLLARHGRLDVLVNNAGVTGFEDGPVAHDPETTTLTDWRAVHAKNLDGVFLGC